MGIAGGTDSSSGEEDGDAEWKAAIDSVAAVDVSSSYGLSKFRVSASNGGSLCVGHSNHEVEKKTKAPGIKLYQIKAQKLLDDLLDKNIEIVTTHIPDNDNLQSDGGLVKLFRKAPPGMRLDPIDQDPGPQKKPKIIPGEYIDEKSKKFRRNIQSVAVNGSDIVAAARLACQSSFARWEARDTAAKAAAKREEERVAELKRIRGEEWLPSLAREMKVSFLTTMKLHTSEHLDGNIV
ncbi:uncharacterized protein LOC110093599 isoform X1 [Dendrobium catenatum]|uniref:Uncharacterized protein n=2 Tax=Dendrobium catenatum TaxID=906689 RepID=A0A2I0XA04_9ASPA|nr:uncharacterized protein LOC110093599 isoform X1 [Dendrobium catenatum]PKU84748.1 hypothetical protein MA16_Dca008158 [Dendrobium catenatum]